VAAIAAGGRLVTDVHAPSWWTLADPEGNEADVATWWAATERGYPTTGRRRDCGPWWTAPAHLRRAAQTIWSRRRARRVDCKGRSLLGSAYPHWWGCWA
jgi:hypothetical protein